MDDFLTSREVAELLGMTQSGVNTRRRAGQLTPAGKLGGVFLFRREDVLSEPRNVRGNRGRTAPADDAA